MNIGFGADLSFSQHKDRILKSFWKTLSYEGRYIITTSDFLQKTHGIDIILQGLEDKAEIKIDTKHIRGDLPNFFLEEYSCPARGRLGWLLKEEGHPDLVYYIYWITCGGCYADCSKCREVLNCIIWVFNFQRLRTWFMKNRQSYKKHQMENTLNKTTGRLVPHNVLEEELNAENLGIYSFPSLKKY